MRISPCAHPRPIAGKGNKAAVGAGRELQPSVHTQHNRWPRPREAALRAPGALALEPCSPELDSLGKSRDEVTALKKVSGLCSAVRQGAETCLQMREVLGELQSIFLSDGAVLRSTRRRLSTSGEVTADVVGAPRRKTTQAGRERRFGTKPSVSKQTNLKHSNSHTSETIDRGDFTLI